MNSFDRIVNWIIDQRASKAMVALSGGVDSALVAAAAKVALDYGAVAVTADYKTLSTEELESAKRVAIETGISHRIIEYNELNNPEFVKNDSKRCYHCRTELGIHLSAEAKKLGISLILDGTNLDDLKEFRPGIIAMREAGVKSPLAELKITKAEVRQIAKMFCLSVHDKPSNSCLASRIPTGIQVTQDKLSRIESAEAIVKSLFGVTQARVRDHGDVARIEVDKSELQNLFNTERLTTLDAKLKALGYRFVSIDAAGYRSGNLVVLPSDYASA